MINISKFRKAQVLAALYNNSRVQGMGVYQAKPGIMFEKEAEALLQENTTFDYLYGKVMKVDLSGDEFKPHSYDRDNGEGAAQRAIDSIGEA
jgi:hypothetical protein